MRTTGVRPTVPRMVSNFAIRPFYPRPRRQATGKARTNFERNSFLILAVVRVLRRARLFSAGKGHDNEGTDELRLAFGFAYGGWSGRFCRRPARERGGRERRCARQSRRLRAAGLGDARPTLSPR